MARARDRMLTRRHVLIVLGAAVLAAPRASVAQPPPARVARVGFLGVESAAGYASRVEAVRAGLRDFGWVEGRNLAIEFRWAEGTFERLPELAAELVALKVDVVLTHGGAGTAAAKRATASIPIVMTAVGDPIAAGIVPNLARPGKNITGTTFFQPELLAKRMELLKVAAPRLTAVALVLNPDSPSAAPNVRAMEEAARTLKVGLQRFPVRRLDQLGGAFAAMARKRVGGVVISEDPVWNPHVKRLADLAARHRLASIGPLLFAEAGGLLGYGVNFFELYRRAGYFVDRILKGASPGDLPIERATRFELVINRKTAEALGRAIPQKLVLRADRLIE